MTTVDAVFRASGLGLCQLLRAGRGDDHVAAELRGQLECGCSKTTADAANQHVLSGRKGGMSEKHSPNADIR
jgi:hypothetical protein